MSMPASRVMHYRELHSQMGEVRAPGVFTKSVHIPEDDKEGHPAMYALGVAVTVLAAGAFIAPNVVAFPFAGPISLLLE